MTRADQLLVSRGLAPTRSAAQRLIAGGAVRWRRGREWQLPRKAGEDLPQDCELEITDHAELRYVSRGGLKLEAALAAAALEPRGLVCLDLGQSTGGFTDCLLQAGAARVVGIDVGHDQLHASLRRDSRVKAFEGLNVRSLAASGESGSAQLPEDSMAGAIKPTNDESTDDKPGGGSAARAFAAALPPGGFDLIVADLSFISLSHALGPARALMRVGGVLLALVKPQFELGRGGVDARGIVRDERRYAEVRERIEQAALASGLTLRGWYDSPIQGGDGNREFFLHAIR
jgi:23S rRNA (cytidine1920-2'-O)/16S rRNA (cytidine1409-2'-O)-methyltransferase